MAACGSPQLWSLGQRPESARQKAKPRAPPAPRLQSAFQGRRNDLRPHVALQTQNQVLSALAPAAPTTMEAPPDWQAALHRAGADVTQEVREALSQVPEDDASVLVTGALAQCREDRRGVGEILSAATQHHHFHHLHRAHHGGGSGGSSRASSSSSQSSSSRSSYWIDRHDASGENDTTATRAEVPSPDDEGLGDPDAAPRVIPYPRRRKVQQPESAAMVAFEAAQEIAEMARWEERLEERAVLTSAAPPRRLKRPRGCLEVRVRCAFDLKSPRPPTRAASDDFENHGGVEPYQYSTYASARVGKERKCTEAPISLPSRRGDPMEAMRRNRNPMWPLCSKPFTFQVDLAKERDRTVHFEVWAKSDSGGDAGMSLGVAELEVEVLTLTPGDWRTLRLQLRDPDGSASGGAAVETAGKLEVEACFVPDVLPQVLVLSDGDAVCLRLPESAAAGCENQLGSGGDLKVTRPSSAGAHADYHKHHYWRYLETRHPTLEERHRKREAAHNKVRQAQASKLAASKQAGSLKSPCSSLTPAAAQGLSAAWTAKALRRKLDKDELVRLQSKLKVKMARAHKKLFTKYDQDGSGYLDAQELQKLLRGGLKISQEEFSDADMETLMKALDENHSGALKWQELVEFVSGSEAASQSVDQKRARELLVQKFGPFFLFHNNV